MLPWCSPFTCSVREATSPSRSVFARSPIFQTYGCDFSAAVKVFSQVNALIFCVNGEATSWAGQVQLKDLRIGDKAAHLPYLEAVEDQEWYRDTGIHTARIMGIRHIAQFNVTGAEKLLRNITFSDVEQGRCTMSFEIIPGATGTAPLRSPAPAPMVAPISRAPSTCWCRTRCRRPSMPTRR